MKKRYDEVMDRIEVTDEMRGRILGNIQKMDIAAPANGRIMGFPNMRKFLSAAACFVVLLAGIFAVGHMAGIFRPDEPDVTIVNGIVEVDTLKQLSAAVGFEVEEPAVLPFTAEETVYVSYWNELAEITCTGGGQSAVFRKSAGTEDNSGDYSAYSSVREITIDSLTVTLKGGEEAYTLAVWSAGGYAYSIRLSDGISESEWHRIVSGNGEIR